jgi:hypothetical protein
VSIPLAKLRCTANASLGTSIWLILVLCAAGCGAPGEPIAPTPPVAAQISDLAGRQAGDGVVLTFTLPTRSMTGDRLLAAPAVEILRGTAKADGSPDVKSLRVIDTIPGSLADKYLVGDKFQFTDPVAPEETKAPRVNLIIYTVRTRLSQKRASANSNVIALRLFSVPEHILSIAVHITEPAIALSWPAVDHTSAGDPLTASPRYNIYRAELDDAAAELAKRDVSQLKLNTNLQLLASQPETTYSDKSFQFGKTYAYLVRSILTIEGAPLESSDSAPAIVSPRDTFPPAVPQGLSAAVWPGESEASLVVDLSWSINVEADFAGYRIYRSEHQGTAGSLLQSELLPTPAYRDTSVQPAHHYWYSVTAVDRTGNESAPSPPAAIEIAQPSP